MADRPGSPARRQHDGVPGWVLFTAQGLGLHAFRSALRRRPARCRSARRRADGALGPGTASVLGSRPPPSFTRVSQATSLSPKCPVVLVDGVPDAAEPDVGGAEQCLDGGCDASAEVPLSPRLPGASRSRGPYVGREREDPLGGFRRRCCTACPLGVDAHVVPAAEEVVGRKVSNSGTWLSRSQPFRIGPTSPAALEDGRTAGSRRRTPHPSCRHRAGARRSRRSGGLGIELRRGLLGTPLYAPAWLPPDRHRPCTRRPASSRRRGLPRSPETGCSGPAASFGEDPGGYSDRLRPRPPAGPRRRTACSSRSAVRRWARSWWAWCW